MKKLLTGLILIGLAIIMTAASSLHYKTYLPLVVQNEIIEYEWHTCTYDKLFDSLGFTPGYIKVSLLIAYHPEGYVRLVKFYDNTKPATNIWTYYKWHAVPRIKPAWLKPNEFNLLWTEPVGLNKEWNYTFVEAVSAWEAVTHIGGSTGYTLNPVAFRKGHFRYPIDCIMLPHTISYAYPYPVP